MSTRTWLSIWSLVFIAGCQTAPNEPTAPSTEPREGALVAGTTYDGSGDDNTQSPIKHVIVIIGENRTFDHVFATYKPEAGAERSTTCCRRGSSTRTARPDRTSRLAAQFSAVDSNPPATSPPLADPLSAG